MKICAAKGTGLGDFVLWNDEDYTRVRVGAYCGCIRNSSMGSGKGRMTIGEGPGGGVFLVQNMKCKERRLVIGQVFKKPSGLLP